MTCPVCKQKSGVTNTAAVGDEVIRRRECKSCRWVFFTKEVVATDYEQSQLKRLLNAKRDGRYKDDQGTTESL